MNKKIGFCISVYDKFEEARILIELIKDYSFVNEIILLRSDNFNQDEFEKYELQSLCTRVIENSKYKYIKSDKISNDVSITARIWESQRSGMLLAAQNNDIVIHTHADGWILKEDFLFELCKNFQKYNLDIGFRGPGLSYRNNKGELIGKLDDHFYIVSAAKIKKSTFLKKDVFELPVDCLNIHGILALWVTAEFEMNKTWHYDDFTDIINWKGEKIVLEDEIPMLRPFHYAEKQRLLHIHRKDFIDERLAKELQAYYLQMNSRIKSNSYTELFIKEYFREIELIRKEIINKISFKLRLIKILGINENLHHNNPLIIYSYFRMAVKTPIKIIKLNLFKILFPRKRFFNKNSRYPASFNEIMAKFREEIMR